MIRKLLVVAIAATSSLSMGQTNQIKQMDGYVSTYPATVIDIADIKVIEQNNGEDSPLDAEILVEVEGTYESHGEEETVMVKLTKKDDGIPMSYQRYEAELYSIVRSSDPVPVGHSYITAISSPKKFKVRFLLKVNSWDTDQQTKAEFLVLFKYKSYNPIWHTVSRGFSATKIHLEKPDLKEWVFHKRGFSR